MLTIGEVARRTGVEASALRYYEKQGVLPPARRAGGQRRYDEQAVRKVLVLRFAQQAGFTLSEVKELFHRFDANTQMSSRWRTLAHAKLRELDELEQRIVQMRLAIEQGLACGCMRIEDCMLPSAVATAAPVSEA